MNIDERASERTNGIVSKTLKRSFNRLSFFENLGKTNTSKYMVYIWYES